MRRSYLATEARALRRARSDGAIRQGDPRYTAYLFSNRQLDLPLWSLDTRSTAAPGHRAAQSRPATRSDD